MANYTQLIKTINDNIKANGNQEITGPVLNAVLQAIVRGMSEGALFAGIADTTTNPPAYDGDVFYIAIEPGKYSNFGADVPRGSIGVLHNMGGNKWVAFPINTYYTIDVDTLMRDSPSSDDIDEAIGGLTYLKRAIITGMPFFGRSASGDNTVAIAQVEQLSANEVRVVMLNTGTIDGSNELVPIIKKITVSAGQLSLSTEAPTSFIGPLSSLNTNERGSVVGAINEVNTGLESAVKPYVVDLTDLLAAQDSESISTAIGGIDNLNGTVQKNQVIFGTLANGTVAVGIRVLGNQTTLTYFVDSVVGLTVNEVIITNTSGTLTKTANTHAVLTENMVVDNLESDEATLPLSAAQGKYLSEEVKTNYQKKNDNALSTTDKTVVGAINELQKVFGLENVTKVNVEVGEASTYINDFGRKRTSTAYDLSTPIALKAGQVLYGKTYSNPYFTVLSESTDENDRYNIIKSGFELGHGIVMLCYIPTKDIEVILVKRKDNTPELYIADIGLASGLLRKGGPDVGFEDLKYNKFIRREDRKGEGVDAYEEGLLDCFIDIKLYPNAAINDIRLWCYEASFYISDTMEDTNSIIFTKSFADINNYEPVDIIVNEKKIGYVVFSDKQKFLDNNAGNGPSLNKFWANRPHEYIWIYNAFLKELGKLSESMLKKPIKLSDTNFYITEEDKNVISPDALPKNIVNPPKYDPIEISLPDKIYAVVGDTLQLFYRGMIQAVDPYRYNILISCAKGKQYPRYFEYLPTTDDVGTTNFTITVKDDNRNVLSTKTCQLVTVDIVKSPTSNLKVMCFGDSLTNSGAWCREADRRLTEAGGTPAGKELTNIDFVGSKKNGATGYFGVGGWTWSSYTTRGRLAYRFQVTGVNSLSLESVYTGNGNTFTIKEINVTEGTGNILCVVDSLTPAPAASGTLTKTSGNGDETITYTSVAEDAQNPLWDTDADKMTFIPYANEVSEGRIDVVYTLLTWNSHTAGRTDFSSMLAQMKIFADTLHSEFPNAKLKIMGVQVPSVRGGMGANYGATGSGYADGYGMIVTAFNMNKVYQEFANDEEYSSFVEFVNVSSQFDTDYMMPHNEKVVNTRSTVKEWMDTNGVHPSNEGYLQIGDVVYRNFIANFCQ